MTTIHDLDSDGDDESSTGEEGDTSDEDKYEGLIQEEE